MTDRSMSARTQDVDILINVRFGDTDPYGVVYCASYFRYCHRGIEEFFRHLGFAPEDLFRNQEQGYGLPVVGASCDFLKPVRYGDSMRLVVSLLQLKTRVLTFGFLFYRATSEELVARGEATMVCIDRNWQSRELPEDLRVRLTASARPDIG